MKFLIRAFSLLSFFFFVPCAFAGKIPSTIKTVQGVILYAENILSNKQEALEVLKEAFQTTEWSQYSELSASQKKDLIDCYARIEQKMGSSQKRDQIPSAKSPPNASSTRRGSRTSPSVQNAPIISPLKRSENDISKIPSFSLDAEPEASVGDSSASASKDQQPQANPQLSSGMQPVPLVQKPPLGLQRPIPRNHRADTPVLQGLDNPQSAGDLQQPPAPVVPELSPLAKRILESANKIENLNTRARFLALRADAKDRSGRFLLSFDERAYLVKEGQQPSQFIQVTRELRKKWHMIELEGNEKDAQVGLSALKPPVIPQRQTVNGMVSVIRIEYPVPNEAIFPLLLTLSNVYKAPLDTFTSKEVEALELELASNLRYLKKQNGTQNDPCVQRGYETAYRWPGLGQAGLIVLQSKKIKDLKLALLFLDVARGYLTCRNDFLFSQPERDMIALEYNRRIAEFENGSAQSFQFQVHGSQQEVDDNDLPH